MADQLDALLERVSDAGLRSELKSHIDRLRRRRSFGLVFESHLPERVRLPDHPIRRGSLVVRRDAPPKTEPREVLGLGGLCRLVARDGTTEDVPRSELVVVAEFGEPIYPGLKRLGSVERVGDKPSHVVIKGENYHALEALRFSHAGKVDCIYIDPPYNTGAKDWKYDNDYVDADDAYRHSKWLAFMERRLLLAKELLNPEDSALIVTIDEKEVHRLGMLLEQTFPDCQAQMVSSVTNPRGTGRQNLFSRTNEYIFFLQIGSLVIQPMMLADESSTSVAWDTFRRRDFASRRGTAKGGRSQFYPIFMNRATGCIIGTGEPLAPDQDRHTAPDCVGCASVFPVRPDGVEMNWALTRDTFNRRLESGYVRVGRHQPNDHQEYVISYLKSGTIADIEAGRAVVVDRKPDGSVVAEYPEGKRLMPVTQWAFPLHAAEWYGTRLLKQFIPGRSFPFPKSLYAVEDVVRIAVGHKPEAVVLDFFAGSGTTAHAVMRLNHEDGGARQSISITNNEVSASEAKSMSDAGLFPGDPEWESLGIFEHITRPRLEAAATGIDIDGEPIKGDYKFHDEFPMAEGFEENIEFLELKYLDAIGVELGLAFEQVAPLLWLRAGATGRMISESCYQDGDPKRFEVTDRYGVLFDTDHWRRFLDRLPESARTVFVVTDSPSIFASIAGELPGRDVVRLYDSYLSAFDKRAAGGG